MKHLARFFCFNFIVFSALASLKIGTYNIKTFDASPGMTNKKELTQILKNLDFDFLTVQEIVNVASFKKLIKKNFPNFKVIASDCGGAGKQKIAFIYNTKKFLIESFYDDDRVSDVVNSQSSLGCHSLRPALVGVFRDIQTREKFVMMGVHLKAGGSLRSYSRRRVQYRKLKQIVDEFRADKVKNIILMGDFNTTGFDLRDSDYKNFSRLLSDTNMTTTSDQISCSSYWSGLDRSDNIEESSILDHIVVPKSFLGKTKTITTVGTHCAKLACSRASESELGISYEQVSDHCPIITTIY